MAACKAEFDDPHVTGIPTIREDMAIKGRRSAVKAGRCLSR